MRNILAIAATFAAGALAQNIDIALPTAGQTVQAGQQLTVQIQRPVSALRLVSWWTSPNAV